MLDLHPFENLLTSISRTTGLQLDVLEKDTIVYSSSPESRSDSLAEGIRQLSLQACEQQSFQRSMIHGRFALFAVPLPMQNNSAGSLVAHCTQEGPFIPLSPSPAMQTSFPDIVKEVLTNLALHMGHWWTTQHESEEMAEQLAASFEELHRYSKITQQISTVVFSAEKFRTFLRELRDAMGVELAFSRFPRNPDFGLLVNRQENGAPVTDSGFFIDALMNAIPAHTTANKEHYYIVNNSHTVPAYRDLHPSPFRFLAVTIQCGEDFYGRLGFVSFNLKEIFRRNELRLLISVAEQLAFVMKNSALFNELGQFVIDVVRSLVYTIEAKDVYTRGHSERVNHFSMLMAERMNLSDEEKEILHWASTLHDIGKIGIPEAILNKTASLNDNEYSTIKSHPTTGRSILTPLHPLVKSLPGILYHHERYDGEGYPDHLKGKEIPLYARIIAVADTFDAITSDRAYRAARSREEALAIIRDVAGTQLDPELVEILMDVLEKESAPVKRIATTVGGT